MNLNNHKLLFDAHKESKLNINVLLNRIKTWIRNIELSKLENANKKYFKVFIEIFDYILMIHSMNLINISKQFSYIFIDEIVNIYKSQVNEESLNDVDFKNIITKYHRLKVINNFFLDHEKEIINHIIVWTFLEAHVDGIKRYMKMYNLLINVK